MAALLAFLLGLSATAQVQDKAGVYVNKRPLKDWSANFTSAVNSKEVDINAPFLVSIVAVLGTTSDGKTVVLKSPKRLTVAQPGGSDPRLISLVEDAILAFGDSGLFGYIDQLIGRKFVTPIKISVRQDETTFAVGIDVGRQNENEAKTMTSGLTTLLNLAVSQANDDDKPLLRSMSVSSIEKSVRLSFAMPRAEFWEVAQKQIDLTAPKKSDN